MRYQVFIGESAETMHYLATHGSFVAADNSAKNLRDLNPKSWIAVRLHPDDCGMDSGFYGQGVQRLFVPDGSTAEAL